MPLWKLALIIHIILMPTLMGFCVVGVLAVDQFATTNGLIGAAAAGFVFSIPMSVVVAQRILKLTSRPA